MKDSNEYLYFSQHVRRIRIERKMTQKEMADCPRKCSAIPRSPVAQILLHIFSIFS